MADPINGINAKGVDLERFKKLTPQEIIKQQSEGEEVPAEIVTWAKDVLSFAQIPDDVTYDLVGGDVGIEALNQLGIPSDEQVGNVEEDAEIPEEENPEIPEPPEEETPDGNNAILAEPNEDEVPADDITLADSSITADNEEIRRRKARKGIVEEQ